MREGKTFDEFMAGRPRREKEQAVSPYGIPGVYEDDARFILAAMGRGQSDVAPNETKAPAPDPEPKPGIPAPAAAVAQAEPGDVPKPKGRRLSKAERLERKAAKLRAEIERLKK